MNSLGITRWVWIGFELCVVLCIPPVIFAQSIWLTNGIPQKKLRTAQESKIDDIFLVKNNDHYSFCVKESLASQSEMLDCLSDSLEKLDGYLSRLMVRKKIKRKVSEQFFESRKILCLKVIEDFDGSNKSIVYADCLRIRTIAEIIKESHSVDSIDDFLIFLLSQKKIPFTERENYFNNRKYFCMDAGDFRSNFSENFSEKEFFYQNCLTTRAVEEVLRRLH